MKQNDNNKRLIRLAVTPLLPLILFGCSDEIHVYRSDNGASGLRLELQATIDQQNDTRADESGFADGDRFGLFVVNYSEGNPGQLTLSDNQVNNVAMTYNADANTWQAATDIYWRDPLTPADVYGYYPFNNGMGDVDAYSFEVRTDQSVRQEGEMCAYEASDLLWAKTTKATPGKKVNLTFSHVMAGVKVILEQGSGFDGDSWTKLEKTVTVDNTVRTSEVDLSNGIVTPIGSYDRNIVMNPEGDAWRAVVVPQAVSAGNSVIGITIDGKPYTYTRADGMRYTAGKLHTFTIKIDRKADGGDYSLTLVNEDIIPWEADRTSHDFESNSYLTVHVAEAGTMKDCLEAMHVDVASIRNLKVMGNLTDEDFRFMREEMSQLFALNLKETKLFNCPYSNEDWETIYGNDIFPDKAFTDQSCNLHKIILPETIHTLGRSCLGGLTLSSTIIIPESVKIIGADAFRDTKGAFDIQLPNNLERIEWCAFAYSQASIKLNLSQNLKYIGDYAFGSINGLKGTFSLPSNLEYLGEGAFSNSGTDLDGEIIIPNKITEIPNNAFCRMGFKKPVTLTLHDGVTRIGNEAFFSLKFASAIAFPKNLKVIGSAAFLDCYIPGDLKLPQNLKDIGCNAFSYSSVKGNIELPAALDYFGGTDNGTWDDSGPFSNTSIESLVIGDNVEVILSKACIGCELLKTVTIGKNVVFIGNDAFQGCALIEKVICGSVNPPRLDPSSFVDVDFSHCVLEVPEQSVEAYRGATGWNLFKSITAHHELNLSISEISCLNKEFSRSLVVRAEGPWEITECPDWVEVTPDHAEYKSEISVKVKHLPSESGDRTDKVVFRLKESGYTTYLTINQFDYVHPEDTEIILLSSAGNGNAVPVFIVGEGYGAESIINGDYMERVQAAVEDFFSIEPYKTYKDMFTVSTAISLSPENGAKDLLTDRETKFGFCFPDIDCPMVSNLTENLKTYVKDVSAIIDDSNIGDCLIIMLSNYDACGGSSYLCPDNCSIACVGVSHEGYPYDMRGLVQHFVGGRAFGGLANEDICHFEHIKGCDCPGCNDMRTFMAMKSKGLYENVAISGKVEDAPWKDFIYHPKYSYLVDMYEGGYNHLRGVWRSEPESVMNNYIPYYNTISRYSIYKQIMKRARLKPSLEEFINNDKIEIPD